MDKKLTDSETVKALENEMHLAEYVDSDYCSNTEVSLLKSTIDLINRLQAENERYRETVGELGIKDGEVVCLLNGKETKYINKQVAETLKRMALETAKAEAYKEFAEQLDAEIESSDKYIREYDDSEVQKAYNKGLRDALKVLKELVGEQPILNDVKCIDCEYLKLELPYAVCSKAYKGIVAPDDSCGKGKLKEMVGE